MQAYCVQLCKGYLSVPDGPGYVVLSFYQAMLTFLFRIHYMRNCSSHAMKNSVCEGRGRGWEGGVALISKYNEMK